MVLCLSALLVHWQICHTVHSWKYHNVVLSADILNLKTSHKEYHTDKAIPMYRLSKGRQKMNQANCVWTNITKYFCLCSLPINVYTLHMIRTITEWLKNVCFSNVHDFCNNNNSTTSELFQLLTLWPRSLNMYFKGYLYRCTIKHICKDVL